jgi:hypothetical protein
MPELGADEGVERRGKGGDAVVVDPGGVFGGNGVFGGSVGELG